MARRSAASSVVDLFAALVEERTWKQADLARKLDVSVEAVRRRLLDLQRAGIPVERQEDHPHVYWSVRKGWLPGGVALTGDEVNVVVRLLARVASSSERDRILERLLQLSPTVATPVPNRAVQEGSLVLPLIEDALARKIALHFEYLSASRLERAWRHASVQHVEYATHAQLVAICHRDGVMKRFRIDCVLQARLDPGEPFRGSAPGAVETFLAESVGGYRGADPVIEHVFTVRVPEASWVQRSLPAGNLKTEHLEGGAIRVRAVTGAIEVIARYVVGLGDAARAETPELEGRVRGIAEAVLRGLSRGTAAQ